MRIHLGSAVQTSDGHVAGKVSRLVLDPGQQTLDALIVHTGWLGHDVIVPLRCIQEVRADNVLRLNITSEGFRRLQPFVEMSFVSSESLDSRDIQTDHLAGGGEVPMPDSGLGSPASSMGHQFDPGGSGFMGVGTSDYDTITTSSSLDESEVAISSSTRVVTNDGHHVGTVHDVRAEADGRLDGLIVTSGYIRVHQSFVPARELIDASPEELWLRLTAAQFAALEQASQSEHVHGEGAP